MKIIKLKETKKLILEIGIWLNTLEGLKFIRTYKKKKYLFFGEITYYAEMTVTEKFYTRQIERAIILENYELAGQLKNEYETFKKQEHKRT